MAALLAAAALSQFWRRHTWHVRWEAATTLTGALMCAALILGSPHLVAFNPTLPDEMTEAHLHPQVIAGHILLCIAYATFLHDLAGRMQWTPRQRRRFVTLRITLPYTVFLPILIGSYITGYEQLCYPVILITYVGTLANICWLLLCIRVTDQRAPHIINTYIAAFTFAVVAAGIRYLTDISIVNCWEWRFATLSAILLMVASTLSWIRKQRYLKAHLWRRVRLEKPIKRRAVERRTQSTPQPYSAPN
ncbi:hypothetical protein [Mycolicibacterium sphagni]|nr:hypothetical protein [Mycolicibacterium sphagni]